MTPVNDRETAAVTRLRNLVMQAREHVEAKDVRGLAELLEGLRHANVNGRFLDRGALLGVAGLFASRIDAPRMHLVRVEALAVDEEVALATYLVDASWTDRTAWREVHTTLLVSFEIRHRTFGWRLDGVTLSELPADARTGPAALGEPLDLMAMSGHGTVDDTFYSFMRYPASPPAPPAA